MSVSLTGRHVAVTPAIRRYVESKVAHLNRLGLDLHQVQVIVSVEKFRQSAEMVCVLNRRRYRAKASSSELYASIDLMMDKIDRQLREKKARLKNHKGRGRRKPEPETEDTPLEPELTVVRASAPMLLRDEAIAKVHRQPDRPVIYVDEESQEVCVLRPLADGKLELTVATRRKGR
ncbi:MAG: ribosome-associated translation inhibitor RaiA [Nitrospiraceae bacterium]